MDDMTINWQIAERLGLKEVQCEDFDEDATILVWIELRDTTGKKYRGDFASSLDAMAEAEATLTAVESWEYWVAICVSTVPSAFSGYPMDWGLLTAPARTRAMAFLEATKNRSVSNE